MFYFFLNQYHSVLRWVTWGQWPPCLYYYAFCFTLHCINCNAFAYFITSLFKLLNYIFLFHVFMPSLEKFTMPYFALFLVWHRYRCNLTKKTIINETMVKNLINQVYNWYWPFIFIKKFKWLCFNWKCKGFKILNFLALLFVQIVLKKYCILLYVCPMQMTGHQNFSLIFWKSLKFCQVNRFHWIIIYALITVIFKDHIFLYFHIFVFSRKNKTNLFKW